MMCSKYKPADYVKLQAIVAAKRQETELIGQKVQRTLSAAKATKENSALRQHRQVWAGEYCRLAQAEEKAESDLHEFLQHIKPCSRTDTAIFTLQDYGRFLEREREAFRIATVEPVSQLRDDLQFRLSNVQHQQLIPPSSDWEQALQQVNLVKDQQTAISVKLTAEGLALEEEITALGLQDHVNSSQENPLDMDTVPGEVLEADCPYPELKESLHQAFWSLTEKYQSRLQDLHDSLQQMGRFCGWPAEDHQRFELTVGQYPHDMPNHRALYMDMLQRLFPWKTREQLTEHERAWDRQRYSQAQLSTTGQSWLRERSELLTRALLTLEEARLDHQEELELHHDRQHQQHICSRLRTKLQQWRSQQEEVERLEAAQAERRQEEEQERMRREQERQAAFRSQQKEKVRHFYLKRQRRREELEKRDQERLSQLRAVMEEQAQQDKERVQFREEMLRRRQEERETRQLDCIKEEEQRQNRLEALRNQVAVVAVADPARMMAHTEAWRSRQRPEQDESVLHKPLYSINTYTDIQIVSDPRVRVEQALREAGLHHTLYAKEVLSGIKPTKPPRRDTKSGLVMDS